MAVFLAVFLMGFEALLGQLLLLRESLVIMGGNELLLGVFYGLWFLGIFVGAAAGGAMGMGTTGATPGTGRVGFFRDPARAARAVLILQTLWLPAAVVGVRCWRPLWGIPEGAWVSLEAAAVCLALTALPFSILTGLAFPLVCRCWTRTPPRAGWDRDAKSESAAVGTVYSIESVGSLAAGILFAFLFVEYIEPLKLSLACAGCVALNASRLGGGGNGRQRWERGAAAALGLALVVVAVTPAYRPLDDFSKAVRWKALAGTMRHVEEKQSRHQQLDLAWYDGQYSLLANGVFSGSFPDPLHAQTQAHLFLAQAPGAQRILLIGGGTAGLPAELLLYPNAQVDYAEVDPAVLDVVRPRLEAGDLAAWENPRMSVLALDGRRHVKQQAARFQRGETHPYDLVISLAPDPFNAFLNRYFTREYFAEVRDALAPEGVFVLRLGSAVNYFGPELRHYLGSIYAALCEVFPHVVATPGEEAYLFASAAPDRLSDDPRVLLLRFEDSGARPTRFRGEYYQMVFQAGHVEQLRGTLEEMRGEQPANTDRRPVSYLHALRLWKLYSGSGLPGLPGAGFWAWVFVAALVARVLFTARMPGGDVRRVLAGNALGVLALTGASGMAVSLLLLFQFQNTMGYLYREIGLLTALFMAGLAAGGWMLRRPRRTGAGDTSAQASLHAARRLAISEALWIAAAMATAGFFAWTGASGGISSLLPTVASGCFFALMFGFGFLTGAQFPLVAHLQTAAGCELGRNAARVESLDHLGAMLGAVLTGLVLIPRFGVPLTLGILACAKLLAAAGLLGLPLLRGRGREQPRP